MSKINMDKIDSLFFKLRNLTYVELATAITKLEEEEKRLSEKRKKLHRRIDHLKKYISEKLSKQRKQASDELYSRLIDVLSDPMARIPTEALKEPIEEKEIKKLDPETLNFDQLEGYYNQLRKEESKISYKRRITQGKLDILRNELIARLESRERSTQDSTKDLVERLSKLFSNKGF